MFSKRHYEWLARWAGYYLTSDQAGKLSYWLADENPRFDAVKFRRAYEKARSENKAEPFL